MPDDDVFLCFFRRSILHQNPEKCMRDIQLWMGHWTTTKTDGKIEPVGEQNNNKVNVCVVVWTARYIATTKRMRATHVNT